MRSGEVRDHYDRLAAVYDRDRNQAFVERGLGAYLEAIAGHEAGGVLEAGCGTGSFVLELRRRGIEAFGVDFSREMCAVARRRLGEAGFDGEALVRQVDVTRSAGFDRKFGAIVLMDSWEFLSDSAAALRTLSAQLAPGGRLVIFTPNPTFRWLLTLLEWTRIKKLRPAFLHGNSHPRTVRAAARAAGLELSERRTLFLGLEQRFLLGPAG